MIEWYRKHSEGSDLFLVVLVGMFLVWAFSSSGFAASSQYLAKPRTQEDIAHSASMPPKAMLCGQHISMINQHRDALHAHDEFQKWADFANAEQWYVEMVHKMIDAWFQTKDTEFYQAAYDICMQEYRY